MSGSPPTVHGVQMQFEDAHGGTLQDMLRSAGIQTEAVGHMYLDVSRHLPSPVFPDAAACNSPSIHGTKAALLTSAALGVMRNVLLAGCLTI